MNEFSDPEDMNVRQLMSALGNAGVDLPPQKMSKQHYVDLFNKHVAEQGRKGSQSETNEKKTDKKKTSKKKTKKVLVTQTEEGSVRDDDDGDSVSTEEEMEKSSSNSKKKTTGKRRRTVLTTTSGNGNGDDDNDDDDVGYFADESQNAPAATATEEGRGEEGEKRKKKRRTVLTTNTTTTEVDATVAITSRPPPQSVTPHKPAEVTATASMTDTTPDRGAPAVTRQENIFQDDRNTMLVSSLLKSSRTPATILQSDSTPQQQTNTLRRRTNEHARTPQSQLRTLDSQSLYNNLLSSDYSTQAMPSVMSVTPASSRTPISPFTPSQVNPKPREPVKSFFLNLVTAIVWGLLFLCLFLALSARNADPSMPHGFSYCDTEAGGMRLMLDQPVGDCQPCPEFGYCARGRLEECEGPYIIRSAICVEDEEITKSAMAMIDILQKDLSVHAGQYECNSGSHALKGLLMDDVSAKLKKKNLHGDNEFSKCFNKMMTLIEENGKSLELAVDQVEVEFEIESEVEVETPETDTEPKVEEEIKPETEIDAETNDAEKTNDAEPKEPEEKEKEAKPRQMQKKIEKKNIIYSTYPQISILCKVTRKTKENITYIAGGIIFFVLIFLGNIWKNKVERAKQEKDDLVSMVLTYLKDNDNWPIEQLRDEIKVQFEGEMDVLKHWSEVEEAVINDGRVRETIGDSYERVWIWEAPIPNDHDDGHDADQADN